MRRSPVLAAALSGAGAATDVRSGTYVLSQARDTAAPTFHPVHGILSSLPRPDLIALSAGAPAAARTLPVSPYPVHAGAAVRAHFVVDRPPDEAGWAPWVGGLWSRWVRGRVLGYRDFAGREAKVGRVWVLGARCADAGVCSPGRTMRCRTCSLSRCRRRDRAGALLLTRSLVLLLGLYWALGWIIGLRVCAAGVCRPR